MLYILIFYTIRLHFSALSNDSIGFVINEFCNTIEPIYTSQKTPNFQPSILKDQGQGQGQRKMSWLDILQVSTQVNDKNCMK